MKMLLTLMMAILLLLVVSSETRAEETPLAPFVGTWQVTGVRLDETLTRTPNYQYDDPRLLRRHIKITERDIVTDMPETTACKEPRAMPKRSSMDVLVQESMGRHKDGKRATVKNFNLPVKGSTALEVLWITCNAGDVGPDTPYGPEGMNWIAPLAQHHLAMRWYDNTILLLNRINNIEGSH